MIARTVATAFLWLLASSAGAVGLGNIEVYSTLYQPLDAEIEILNTKEIDIRRLKVALANEEAFRSTGINQLVIFGSFRFEVIEKSGRYFVHITSGSSVIRDPFLHFLVHLDWVYGNLVREYTVLLDLPLFGEGSDQALRSDIVLPEGGHALDDSFDTGVPVVLEPEPSEPVPEPEPEISDRSDFLVQQELEEVPDSSFEEDIADPIPLTTDQYGPVNQGENLWTIVADLKPQDVTMNQAMLAVLRANTGSFINDNINLLKTGVTLSIPGYEEMLELARVDALEEAKRQNALWDEYRGAFSDINYRVEDSDPVSDESSVDTSQLLESLGAAIEEPAEPISQTTDVAPDTSSQLKILPGEQDKIDSAAGTADRQAETEVDLDTIASQVKEGLATEESLAEKDQSQITKIEQQQQIAQRLLDLQSDQGATLQERASKLADAAQATTKDGAVDSVGAEQETLPEDTTSTLAQESASTTPGSLSDILAQSAKDAQAKVESDTQEATSLELGLGDYEQRETPLDFLKIVLPRSWVNSTWLAIEDVLESPGKVVDYPIMLGVLLFILAAIVGLIWKIYQSRRSGDGKDTTTIHALSDQFDEFGNPIGDGQFAGAQPELPDEAEAFPQDTPDAQEETIIQAKASPEPAAASHEPAPAPAPAPTPASAPAPTPASAPPQAPPASAGGRDASLGDASDSTIVEANTYISYALFDQAEELLRDSLKRNPANKNAYLSGLIDLYFSSNNVAELVKLAKEIETEYGSGDLWEKVVVLGRAIAAEEEIFKDAKIEGKFTTKDFDIAQPAQTDLSFDATETGSAHADFDLAGDESESDGKESGGGETDIQLTDDEDFLSQFEEEFDKTMADLGLGEVEGTGDGADEKKKS